jgi:hypothetical protein
VTDLRTLQRSITATVLRAVGGHGFVLAGSGAIREHGLVDRATRDVDLFTDRYDQELFRTAVEDAVGVLTAVGYGVEVRRRAELFAQLLVTAVDGERVELDLGYDWRGSAPSQLAIGPVLAVDDAVASKLDALYGRLEVRDFIDATRSAPPAGGPTPNSSGSSPSATTGTTARCSRGSWISCPASPMTGSRSTGSGQPQSTRSVRACWRGRQPSEPPRRISRPARTGSPSPPR